MDDYEYRRRNPMSEQLYEALVQLDFEEDRMLTIGALDVSPEVLFRKFVWTCKAYRNNTRAHIRQFAVVAPSPATGFPHIHCGLQHEIAFPQEMLDLGAAAGLSIKLSNHEMRSGLTCLRYLTDHMDRIFDGWFLPYCEPGPGIGKIKI